MSSSSSKEIPLEGRSAIVTGASGGIGAAVAAHLSSLGANLVLSYSSNAAAATSLAATLTANSPHPRAVAVKADVSSAAGAKTLFDATEEVFGEAHILVCCAGTIEESTLAATEESTFDEIFRVNAKGVFLCCREGANRIAEKGRIVVITSSMVGQMKEGFGAYVGSKAAAEAMVRVLAKELGGKGITANCVAPGPTATEMFYKVRKTKEEVKKVAAQCPLGRVGRPEDVARVVGFLVTDGGRWINGQTIRANGGIA